MLAEHLKKIALFRDNEETERRCQRCNELNSFHAENCGRCNQIFRL